MESGKKGEELIHHHFKFHFCMCTSHVEQYYSMTSYVVSIYREGKYFCLMKKAPITQNVTGLDDDLYIIF